jgi:hypothetical protein
VESTSGTLEIFSCSFSTRGRLRFLSSQSTTDPLARALH